MTNIAIFASGSGSNAQKIIEYFCGHPQISVSVVISGNPRAGVKSIAKQNNIAFKIISKEEFKDPVFVLDLMKHYGVEWIALAGFLWLLPVFLVKNFPNKIFNIHPSLLPKYGGKGMYGIKVHEAVADNNDLVTGLTIHLVNEKYDEGRILFQKQIGITSQMNPYDIAQAVLNQEHKYYAKTIEKHIISQLRQG